MSSNRTSWHCLPPEIQNNIIRLLPVLGGRCSRLATVSRDWHSIIEPLNFAEISLTVPRLADLSSRAILFRKRSQIRYVWFRVELTQYDCTRCHNTDLAFWSLDDQFIADAFESLFTTLAAWEPRGNLVLDISVYSPSDNQHWFKYLSFRSDTNLGESSSPRGHEQETTLINDPAHGWVAGRQVVAPSWYAIEQTFEEIMADGPFDEEEPEMQWWRSLPLVPVVGVLLLRQQTRRRWKPVTLANMLTRFPNMKELCYEPWREWERIQPLTDHTTGNQTLIESLSSTKLCKLVIFENFNESYPERFTQPPTLREPDPAVSQKLANVSLHLTTLSASFMVDAGFFFAARRDSWKWEKLTSLVLTSSVLTHDADTSEINNMLRDAAAAALKMPRLGTMELWNGRRGVAMLFRYQRARNGQSVIMTVRGTSDFSLGVAATEAWDMVARRHRHGRVVVQTSSIDPDVIRCHGDAILHLGLSTEVVRPVSLRQILSEHGHNAAAASKEVAPARHVTIAAAQAALDRRLWLTDWRRFVLAEVAAEPALPQATCAWGILS
ncbi:hypothetical protein MAC_09826 [Metarhizium acridum CQMa 102]|uniref:DUF6546 domain-containing protein n=1 Tax=Metarhizium acridum (strain CQMa 102) TaxID=655827 RepID=E9EIX8_METAQ|nr:uncharacterized protein MAC_09826 [Metarhizium acridum CQMa 102]EFY84131.1 hypothetical protein MAC_09826 [Metarhizium acridum CQMa 102]